jgi:hypothetical protein
MGGRFLRYATWRNGTAAVPYKCGRRSCHSERRTFGPPASLRLLTESAPAPFPPPSLGRGDVPVYGSRFVCRDFPSPSREGPGEGVEPERLTKYAVELLSFDCLSIVAERVILRRGRRISDYRGWEILHVVQDDTFGACHFERRTFGHPTSLRLPAESAPAPFPPPSLGRGDARDCSRVKRDKRVPLESSRGALLLHDISTDFTFGGRCLQAVRQCRDRRRSVRWVGDLNPDRLRKCGRLRIVHRNCEVRHSCGRRRVDLRSGCVWAVRRFLGDRRYTHVRTPAAVKLALCCGRGRILHRTD